MSEPLYLVVLLYSKLKRRHFCRVSPTCERGVVVKCVNSVPSFIFFYSPELGQIGVDSESEWMLLGDTKSSLFSHIERTTSCEQLHFCLQVDASIRRGCYLINSITGRLADPVKAFQGTEATPRTKTWVPFESTKCGTSASTFLFSYITVHELPPN